MLENWYNSSSKNSRSQVYCYYIHSHVPLCPKITANIFEMLSQHHNWHPTFWLHLPLNDLWENSNDKLQQFMRAICRIVTSAHPTVFSFRPDICLRFRLCLVCLCNEKNTRTMFVHFKRLTVDNIE